MKNYNEEYFYLQEVETNHYPMMEYDYDGGDSMEVYDEIPLDLSEKRIVCFAKPIPSSPKLADYHFLGENCPVISERLKNVLESFNLKDVQFLPTIIRDKKGDEHEGYYIIHVVNLIECMDKEKSDWKPSKHNKGEADYIDKLVLDNELIDKVPIEERLVFAAWENSLKVLYHRSVVEKILEIEPTGLTIYRLSKWDSKLPFIEGYVSKLTNNEDEDE